MEPDASSRYSLGMPTDPTIRQIEEMIVSGRELVRQAEEALARAGRFFAEYGIDPEKAETELRRVGGQEAVDAVNRKVEEKMKEIEDAVWREQMHARPARPPAGRRRSVRPTV